MLILEAMKTYTRVRVNASVAMLDLDQHDNLL